jgi:hypothetical protein
MVFLFHSFFAQEVEWIEETFKTTRIINGHSNEILERGTLEFRVEHKFGDLAGSNGGLQNFFGIDNASDIRIAFEYGLTERIMVGLGRSKGYGPYRGLLDGFAKVKILQQNASGSVPISITAVGGSMITYAKASEDPLLVTFYPEFAHRLAYSGQIVLTRKFKDYASLALIPTYTHRNYVAYNDQNGLFSLGAAARIKLNDKFALLGEYYYNFDQEFLRQDYKNSLAFAFEWATFGHVFSLYLANAGGFGEQQFIPYTIGDWTKGQFRAGFAITRKFEF